MKSGPRNAGNYNLKGKKHHGLSCLCCEVQNFKEDYFTKLARKEMEQDLGYIDGGTTYNVREIVRS